MGRIGKQECAELMVKNRMKFYRIAYSYVKNEQDALDIVSEATYRGISHLKELREPEYFSSWMTRIVINTAIEMLRKNARHVVLEDYMLEDCAEQTIDQEIRFDLYQALDALCAEDKAYIILKYFEGYCFRDIAELFGMPESTVKSKVYKCLGSMRKYMEGGGKQC